MQQLAGRDTCTPTDAAPVCGHCDASLNREVTLSVTGLKTPANNSEEHRRSSTSGLDLRVPVINMRGLPLMPTRPRTARKLLEQGKARVVQRTPFTIQLSYPTGETTQEIAFGLDSGYSKIGYSAITSQGELLAGELALRTDIPHLMKKRRIFRSARRSRKWYRQPRFNNRRRKDGWLPPSLAHKLYSHIRLIERMKRILPISKVVIEVATFDIQKLQNPEITGVEYQHGELHGYSVKEYLLEKWEHRCAYCGKTDAPLEVEHIIPTSRGGTNRVSNLTIACRHCNLKKGNKTAEEFGHRRVQKHAMASLKAASFMNVVRRQLVKLLNCEWTYGYITKYHRRMLGFTKSHAIDAFIIAGGRLQPRLGSIYVGKQVRRQNRSLFKANFLKGGETEGQHNKRSGWISTV